MGSSPLGIKGEGQGPQSFQSFRILSNPSSQPPPAHRPILKILPIFSILVLKPPNQHSIPENQLTCRARWHIFGII